MNEMQIAEISLKQQCEYLDSVIENFEDLLEVALGQNNFETTFKVKKIISLLKEHREKAQECLLDLSTETGENYIASIKKILDEIVEVSNS